MSIISCKLQKSVLKSSNCQYALPEIKEIYIANFDDVSGVSIDYDCTSGVTVSAITSGSGIFFKIEPSKGSASWTDELVVTDNGQKYRTHSLTFTLPGTLDKDLVCPIDSLSVGRFIAVVKNGNQYLMLGSDIGLEATEGSTAGGGDTIGATITLAANCAESVYPLTQAAVDSVLASV